MRLQLNYDISVIIPDADDPIFTTVSSFHFERQGVRLLGRQADRQRVP